MEIMEIENECRCKRILFLVGEGEYKGKEWKFGSWGIEEIIFGFGFVGGIFSF